MHSLRPIDSRVARQALCTMASVRRIEAESTAVLPAHALMARAGEAVARLAIAIAPHAYRVLVFAGPGNNGGDGIEAALRLRDRGRAVGVVLVAQRDDPPADAARALRRGRDAGLTFVPHASAATFGDDAPALVIDALLGIGAARPPHGEVADAIGSIAALSARGARVLAIDVPSGLDADRGQPLGEACVRADHTLTLLAAKPGLHTAAGRDHAGSVWLDTLGTDEATAPDAWLIGVGDADRRAGQRRHAQHKGSFGDVAVVGGAAGMTGAAFLAARASLAAGAGRVYLDLLDVGATPFDATRPELMLHRDWWQGPASAIEASTVVCGCGGGTAVRSALPRLIALAGRMVIDADALNAIASDPALRAVLGARAGRDKETILTPHPLEAARLLGVSATEVQADRLGAAAALAERFSAVVVLKGSGTVVAAAGETPCIAATGNASLATAGTGDVLAGWLGGRWLPGPAAFDVAATGVVEHGAAAEPAGRGALRAADLIERLYADARRP